MPAPNISGVVCCGNIVRDIAVGPVTEPRWDRSTWVDFISEGIGGNGANTAYTLAKLGIPVRLIGSLGADDAGNIVLATLQSTGVDTSFVERSNLPTPTTIALVNSNGARALLHRLGASREAFKNPIEFTNDLIAGCTWFHLGNVFALPLLRPRAADLVERARASGLAVSIDTGWDTQGEWMRILEPCLQHTDLLFVNEDEARELTGINDPSEAAAALLRQGVQTVVVKLGAAGCVIHSNTTTITSPAFPVEAIDTTGAGDCFAGGFLAALQRGFSYEQAARFANAIGALNVQKLGCIAGLLDFDATIAWIRAH